MDKKNAAEIVHLHISMEKPHIERRRCARHKCRRHTSSASSRSQNTVRYMDKKNAVEIVHLHTSMVGKSYIENLRRARRYYADLYYKRFHDKLANFLK